MSSLSGRLTSEVYGGYLHSNAQPLINIPGFRTGVYDGSGQKSALSLGVEGEGAIISGNLSTDSLTVGGLAFPTQASTVGSVVVQTSLSTLALSSGLPMEFLQELTPSPAGDYKNIKKISVNSRGLITSVEDHYSDNYYVMSTVYLPNARTAYASPFTLTSSWSQIELSTSLPATTKGIIGYIRPYEYLLDVNKYLEIQASPDNGGEIYPVLFMQGAGTDPSTSAYWGTGAQFNTRVGISNNTPVIYLRALGNASTALWNLHVIAYQL